jgi:hypothetical protein
MLNFLAKGIETVVDVAKLPISAAADAVTLFGAITEREEPYTVTNIKQIVEDVESLGEGNGG